MASAGIDTAGTAVGTAVVSERVGVTAIRAGALREKDAVVGRGVGVSVAVGVGEGVAVGLGVKVLVGSGVKVEVGSARVGEGEGVGEGTVGRTVGVGTPEPAPYEDHNTPPHTRNVNTANTIKIHFKRDVTGFSFSSDFWPLS
jgi:hypothetical protein